jgi:hypothetical protein
MDMVPPEVAAWAEREFGPEVVSWTGRIYDSGAYAAAAYGGYGMVVFAATLPVTTTATMVGVAGLTLVGATTAAIGMISFGLHAFGASEDEIERATDVAAAFGPAGLPATAAAYAGGNDLERATTIGANAFKVTAGALSVGKGFADLARGGATQKPEKALKAAREITWEIYSTVESLSPLPPTFASSDATVIPACGLPTFPKHLLEFDLHAPTTAPDPFIPSPMALPSDDAPRCVTPPSVFEPSGLP